MPNRLVTITATTIGGGINTVDIYHTSNASTSNLITQSITPTQLQSGFTFSDDDTHTVYIVQSDSACGVSASVTIGAAPTPTVPTPTVPTPTVPTPTPTVAPTASPTPTPAPTASPTPALATPVDPGPSPTPVTASPTPTVTPTPSPIPSPSSPSPGGGSTGGGCIVNGTPILLADGTTKNVEDLVIGDEVLAYNIDGLGEVEEWANWSTTSFNGTAVTSSVTANPLSTYESYYLFNNVLKATYEHPILIDRAGTYSWERAEDIAIGDKFFNSSGIWMEVTSKELITESVQVANPDMEAVDNYYANGYLVHNSVEEKTIADAE